MATRLKGMIPKKIPMPLYPIRPAHLPQDAEKILEVFASAKGIMVADGNTKQWVNGDERLDYQRMNAR